MKIQKWNKKKIAEKAASNGLSVGQQRDQDKLRRIIEEKQLTSRMNDSKWNEVIQAIKIDFKNEIIAALNQANVPISITKTGIRVIAYLGSESK